MSVPNREARVGDQVRVDGGVHDGKRGFIGLIRRESDVLFEQGSRPLVGLLKEDMALVKTTDGEEVGVPVRRLKVL